MAVNVLDSGYRLDRLIQVAPISIGTVGSDGESAGVPYSVRLVFFGGVPGSLLTRWNAIPVDADGNRGGDGTRWLLYDVHALFSDDSFDPLYGVFPRQAGLIIAGEAATIESFAVPRPVGGSKRLAGVDQVADVARVNADGNAVFDNGVSGTEFHTLSVRVTLGSERQGVSAVIVVLDEAVTVGTETAAQPGVAEVRQAPSGEDDDAGLNLVIGDPTDVWSQRLDSTTAPLGAPSGTAAEQTEFEETRTYLLRERIGSDNVIIDEGLRFSVSDISEVGREYYRVACTRRYVGVSL